MSFHKGKEVHYVGWVFYLLAASAIFGILVRHWLLSSERLQPDALGCCQCSKAAFTWLKSLCQAPFCERTAATNEPMHCHERVVRYCTFSCVAFYLLYCLNQLLMYSSAAIIGWLPFAYCENSYRIGPALYFAAKASMYCVFVARLQLGFADTKYSLSKAGIRALYGCVGVSQLLFFSLIGLVKGERTHNGSVHNCKIVADTWIHFSVLLFDLFFTVLVVYLFVSKLKKMLRDFEQNIGVSENMDRNADIYVMPLKYTILSSTAALSTISAIMLIAATGLAFLFAVDCVVNSAALVLMTGKWSPAFDKMCTPLLKCLPCAALMGAETNSVLRKISSTRDTENPSKTDGSEIASDLQSSIVLTAPTQSNP